MSGHEWKDIDLLSAVTQVRIVELVTAVGQTKKVRITYYLNIDK